MGCFQRLVILWLEDPLLRDAKLLKKALKKTVTDHKASTDIICSRSPSQLRQLKQAYSSLFNVQLTQAIEKEAHGDHKRVYFVCHSLFYH